MTNILLAPGNYKFEEKKRIEFDLFMVQANRNTHKARLNFKKFTRS